MSKTIETTLQVARDFMASSQHVKIDKMGIGKFIDEHKDRVLEHKVKIEINRQIPESLKDAVLIQLLSTSVDYNFWFGKYNVRPNKSTSAKMHKLLLEAHREVKESSYASPEFMIVDKFIEKLSIERFPNLENRVKHLKEVAENMDFVSWICRNIENGAESLEDLEEMIKRLPGFADDIFMKRAFLFFISLNRSFGFYEKYISEIPIPADYIIPKVLSGMGILTYGEELSSKISHQELIPAGSMMECEIRSGTILACTELAETLNVPPSVVDDYLFNRGREFNVPFHLTVTTWY